MAGPVEGILWSFVSSGGKSCSWTFETGGCFTSDDSGVADLM